MRHVLRRALREAELATRVRLDPPDVADALPGRRHVAPERLDLVAEQLGSYRECAVRGVDVERAAADGELARVLGHVDTLVAHAGETIGRILEVERGARAQRQRLERLGRAARREQAQQPPGGRDDDAGPVLLQSDRARERARPPPSRRRDRATTAAPTAPAAATRTRAAGRRSAAGRTAPPRPPRARRRASGAGRDRNVAATRSGRTEGAAASVKSPPERSAAPAFEKAGELSSRSERSASSDIRAFPSAPPRRAYADADSTTAPSRISGRGASTLG